MSGHYLDGDTLDQCQLALRDGATLADVANRLHVDCEYLGRLLGLQHVPAIEAQHESDLWAADRAADQF